MQHVTVINSQVVVMLQYIKFSTSQPSSLRKDFGGYTGSKDFVYDMVTIWTFSYVAEFCDIRISQYTNYEENMLIVH
jgi:hypothetical protein